ncbi:MAG: hypothetical protein WB995_00765 [Candidatus Acidiferrales bacterium]
MRFHTACWLLVLFCVAASLPALLPAQQSQQNDNSSPGSTQSSPEPQSDWQSPQVPAGTRFLVGLLDELNTKTAKPHQQFTVKTLESLDTPDGHAIPAGTVIRGHVSRVEPGSSTGRARIWLSFDEIETRAGWKPLVADVTEVPGEHAVKSGEIKEGEIQARTSASDRDLQAAAAGAALGAAAGAAAKNGKAAAIGAATGALTAFLVSSGLGQELELAKGTKLELELQRPLYLARR